MTAESEFDLPCPHCGHLIPIKIAHLVSTESSSGGGGYGGSSSADIGASGGGRTWSAASFGGVGEGVTISAEGGRAGEWREGVFYGGGGGGGSSYPGATGTGGGGGGGSFPQDVRYPVTLPKNIRWWEFWRK